MFEASKRFAIKFLSGFVYLDSLLMDSFDLQSDSFESVASKTRKLFVWNVPLAIDDVTWFKSNFKLVAWLICVGSACQQLKYLHLRKKK